MEVFEQLRLLIILIMAFLSYRYVGTQPLSLTASEEDEEELISPENHNQEHLEPNPPFEEQEL